MNKEEAKIILYLSESKDKDDRRSASMIYWLIQLRELFKLQELIKKLENKE